MQRSVNKVIIKRMHREGSVCVCVEDIFNAM